LKEILVPEGETVAVGTVLARIATGAPAAAVPQQPATQPTAAPEPKPEPAPTPAPQPAPAGDGAPAAGPIPRRGPDGRFYSPLVRSIAEKEGLTPEELAAIPGSGRGGRVTKQDVLQYLEQRRQRVQQPAARPAEPRPAAPPKPERPAAPRPAPQVVTGTQE